MTPDTIRELRDFLTAVSLLLSEGPRAHPSWLKTCEDLLAALPPDPGGAMPEPDAGMRVTMANGRRLLVEWAEAPTVVGAPWWSSFSDGDGCMWLPNNIREIRTPDGRVLWRAEEK